MRSRGPTPEAWRGLRFVWSPSSRRTRRCDTRPRSRCCRGGCSTGMPAGGAVGGGVAGAARSSSLRWFDGLAARSVEVRARILARPTNVPPFDRYAAPRETVQPPGPKTGPLTCSPRGAAPRRRRRGSARSVLTAPARPSSPGSPAFVRGDGKGRATPTPAQMSRHAAHASSARRLAGNAGNRSSISRTWSWTVTSCPDRGTPAAPGARRGRGRRPLSTPRCPTLPTAARPRVDDHLRQDDLPCPAGHDRRSATAGAPEPSVVILSAPLAAGSTDRRAPRTARGPFTRCCLTVSANPRRVRRPRRWSASVSPLVLRSPSGPENLV